MAAFPLDDSSDSFAAEREQTNKKINRDISQPNKHLQPEKQCIVSGGTVGGVVGGWGGLGENVMLLYYKQIAVSFSFRKATPFNTEAASPQL